MALQVVAFRDKKGSTLSSWFCVFGYSVFDSEMLSFTMMKNIKKKDDIEKLYVVGNCPCYSETVIPVTAFFVRK